MAKPVRVTTPAALTAKPALLPGRSEYVHDELSGSTVTRLAITAPAPGSAELLGVTPFHRMSVGATFTGVMVRLTVFSALSAVPSLTT